MAAASRARQLGRVSSHCITCWLREGRGDASACVGDMVLAVVTRGLAHHQQHHNTHASHHGPHGQGTRRNLGGLAHSILAHMPEMVAPQGRSAMGHQYLFLGSQALWRLDGARHPPCSDAGSAPSLAGDAIGCTAKGRGTNVVGLPRAMRSGRPPIGIWEDALVVGWGSGGSTEVGTSPPH